MLHAYWAKDVSNWPNVTLGLVKIDNGAVLNFLTKAFRIVTVSRLSRPAAAVVEF